MSPKPDQKKTTKRQLAACVPGMSVLEERNCLAQVRKLGVDNIDAHTRLTNGLLAQQFCLQYVIHYRNKRITSMNESKLRKRRAAIEKVEAKIAQSTGQ